MTQRNAQEIKESLRTMYDEVEFENEETLVSVEFVKHDIYADVEFEDE